ncbi:MAG: glycosyltransferase family 2 protein [Ignavibacteriae bacterium]|nr:MAG: glycosyltransferase family 2 protein [Ignavibacteriota bacterium]
MSKSVSIIILNFNGKRFLKDCLTSVLSQSYDEFEIILFDNNSTDESIKYVTENFADTRVKIVESSENLGFAGGNNEAVKYCRNDLVVLLNNDTKVEKEWLAKLVNAVNEKNTIASSFVITEGIDKKYFETNGSVSYMMYNVMNIFPNINDVFYPNGCSMIFRKSEIGIPFDSDYFYYSEDLWLGLKARFTGMKVKFVKDSIVHHYGGGGNSSNAQRTFYQERNRLLNLYTFFSIPFIIKVCPYITFIKTAKLFLSIFSSKYSFTGLIKAYLWFYFHIPTVLRKRKALKTNKEVNENELIKYMTSKIVNNEGKLNKFINSFSYFYSRIVGIKPFEYYQLRMKN